MKNKLFDTESEKLESFNTTSLNKDDYPKIGFAGVLSEDHISGFNKDKEKKLFTPEAVSERHEKLDLDKEGNIIGYNISANEYFDLKKGIENFAELQQAQTMLNGSTLLEGEEREILEKVMWASSSKTSSIKGMK